eukprot:5641756-Prymnesium_polylepis.1
MVRRVAVAGATRALRCQPLGGGVRRIPHQPTTPGQRGLQRFRVDWATLVSSNTALRSSPHPITPTINGPDRIDIETLSLERHGA